MEKKRLSVRPIMLGLAAAMGAYLVLLTLTAYLTVSGRLDEVRIGQAVWACACLSVFGGAMMTLRGKRGAAALPLPCCILWKANTKSFAVSGSPSLHWRFSRRVKV